MKKFLKTFSIVFVLILSAICFVGCPSNKKVEITQLSAPSLVTVEKADQDVLVNISEVENASAYKVNIDGVDYLSSTNVFNATNVIVQIKEYTIYAVAVGTGNYSNSENSSEVKFTNYNKFSKPILSQENYVLSWSAVEGAESYTLKVNNSSEFTYTSRVVNLKEDSNFSALVANIGENTFTVRANESGYTRASDFSGTVTVVTNSKLSTVSDLEIVKQNENINLVFGSVSGATSYDVYVNNNFAKNVQTVSDSVVVSNISEFLTEAGKHSVSVVAKSTNKYVLNSEISESATYEIFKKFETPTISSVLIGDDSVEIVWNAISNANSYTLTINNEQFNTTIWANQCSVTKSYLSGLTAPYNFKVCANKLGYYLASDYSNVKSIQNLGKFNAPENITVSKNNGKVEVNFNAVEKANSYTILIDGTTEQVVYVTKVDVSGCITEAKSYSIKVKTNAYVFISESDYSDAVYYSELGSVSSPAEVTATVVGKNMNVSWTASENASKYVVQVSKPEDTNFVTFESEEVEGLSYTYRLLSVGTYYASVKAVGGESYTDSAFSENATSVFKTALAKVGNVSLTDNATYYELSWNSVANAEGYNVKVNGVSYTATDNVFDLQKSELDADIYYVFVSAIPAEESYYLSEECSQSVSFVYGATENVGDTYYYEGFDADYNITSQEELNHATRYAILYELSLMKVKILFDYTEDVASEYFYEKEAEKDSNYHLSDTTIYNEYISAICSNRNACWYTRWFEMDYETKILQMNFTHHGVKEPTLSTTQVADVVNANFSTLYAPSTLAKYKRSETYDDFAIESLEKSVTVNCSTELVWVIQYCNRKPAFVGENSQVEQVYNSAKSVLRQIVSNDMTDYDKVVAIYDWLVTNITYDHALLDVAFEDSSKYYGYYPEGIFFNKIAVCAGYSSAFSIMCAIEGIPSRSVGGSGHAWNKVCIGGEWFSLDPTNGSVSFTGKHTLTHLSNFLVSDANATSSIAEGNENTPIEIVSTGETNYYKNYKILDVYDLCIDSKEEFMAVTDYFYNLGRVGFEYTFESEGNVNRSSLYYWMKEYINSTDYENVETAQYVGSNTVLLYIS